MASTTTVTAPESSYKKKKIAPNTAKASTDRVEARASEVTPERKAKALEKMNADKKTVTPKAKTNETTGASVKSPNTMKDDIAAQLIRLQKEKEANSITKDSLGIDYGNESFRQTAEQAGQPIQQAEDPYAYAREGSRYPIGGDQGGTQINTQGGGQQGIQQGGQQDMQPTAPLPPAQELPPDAPLWLKLIRGILTPVPPLAMIPHMFIQGMQQKRAAAQAEDDKNMEYFWDMYDRNPMAAAQLAKTPLFRDTLQRKHGFEAKDLDEINKVAAGQPYKSSELAQMTGAGVVDRASGQAGLQQGDRRFGIKEPNVKLGPTDRYYSGEEQRVLYDAKNADLNSFFDIYKEVNPKATKLEALIAQQNITDKKDQVKWMLAGDKVIAWDTNKPFSQMKENEGWFALNNKNKGKAEVHLTKNAAGATTGISITNPNVEDAKEIIDPVTQEKRWDYATTFIGMDELMYGSLMSKYGDDIPTDPNQIAEDGEGVFRRIMKSLWREIGGDFTGNEKMADLVIERVLERIMEDMQAKGGGNPGTSTATSVSPEVEKFR